MSDLDLAPNTIDEALNISAGALENRDKADFEQTIGYWRKQLAGIPAVLELPTDRTRPPVKSFLPARESIQLPQDLHESLQLLCEREGVEIFVVLLAAFQTLLMRYTRQEDVVVGTSPGARVKDGHFSGTPALNAIPIRGDLSGDPNFRELVARVANALREAREHREISWEQLVEAVEPEQDASRHPIFQAAFSLTDSLAKTALQPGCTSEPEVLNIDLQLHLSTGDDSLGAEFAYSADLFDAATIRRMAAHFQRLLEAVVANPHEQISRLPLLTDGERQQLLVEWNNTRTDYPREACIHHLFEAQAARTPNAVAVVFENTQFTYCELNARANQLARCLVNLGVGPNVLVGICVERSLDMVVGLLGILKAGGAYVPVDPAFPADRIAFMLEDAEVPVLLTQESLVSSLPRHTAALVRLDFDWSNIATESSENLPIRSRAADCAYTIYTSGSTGKPKGVQIPHCAVVNFLTSMAETPGMTARDRLLAVTTLSFDIAGLEIYLPLTLGASVEIVNRSVYSDGKQLLERLNNSSATIMQATPATWRMLLEAGWKSSPGLKILVGGEAVPAKLANELMQRAESVWNMYGPTETTIWSTVRKFEPGVESVSIGRPIANTEIFILDRRLQPVPIGVAGELLIGGDGLATGYFKRPELTAEKFIAHPLSDRHGDARLYKTGDLARYLPNGEIEFLGRMDHQVKIRGFRIELGEIEAVLRQHAGVSETVVVAREDAPGDKRVVAYFVPKASAPANPVELRAFLKEKLPVYMLPSAFVKLGRIPLTPNGKVDRRVLPTPDPSDFAAGQEPVSPRDEVESQLVTTWEDVLGVRPIGIRDNFFDLGGHSILAVRLMNRIAETLDKNLPISTLLQAPTVEKLAAMIRQQGSLPAWSCLVPIQTSGSQPPFFCVHGINGAVVRFRDLAKYLGPDQPFYGLQAYGLGDQNPCHTRTEEMAAHYIQDVRKVQPRGPYFLGGYSFGGAIAFEMALQLAAEGDEGTTVVLFDTNLTSPLVPSTHSISARAAFLQSFRVPASELGAHLLRILRAPLRMLQWKLHVAKLPPIVRRVRKACLQAERSYLPRVYRGRVILFRSNHRALGQVGDPRAGWQHYVSRGLEIYEITGNHENILLEPQVREVADSLKLCLQSAPEAQVLRA